jgi:hypothetical protein
MHTEQLPPPRTMSDTTRTSLLGELERTIGKGQHRGHFSGRLRRPSGLVIGIALGGAVAAGGVATAATTGGWFNSSGVPIAKPPPMQPEQLPPGNYDGHPLNVPSGPQESVADCPQNPQWSPPLPAGATVTVTLQPSGPAGAIVNGRSISVAGYCDYTVTLPGQATTTTAGG